LAARVKVFFVAARVFKKVMMEEELLWYHVEKYKSLNKKKWLI